MTTSDLKIKALITKTPILPLCDAKVEPQGWNGYSNKCRNQAKVCINKRKMCRKHAGSYLLSIFLNEPYTDIKGRKK